MRIHYKLTIYVKSKENNINTLNYLKWSNRIVLNVYEIDSYNLI